jgi:hypothetical protein
MVHAIPNSTATEGREQARTRQSAPKGDGLLRTAQARERPPVEEERRLIAQLLQKLDPRLLPAALASRAAAGSPGT